jgi:hypothetical protein
MCLVADPPTLVPIFKQADPDHAAFSPVKSWVISGPGKFVIGGSKYRAELNAVRSILPFLTELEKRGKIVRKSDAEVDAEERKVKLIEPSSDFDDPHLVALIRLTGCKLICVRDTRSHKFLRATRLYRVAKERPHLYTRAKNANLLCNNNLSPCCK